MEFCLPFPIYFRRLVLEHSEKLYGPVIFYEDRIKYLRYITYLLRLLLDLVATGSVPSYGANCNHEQYPAASSRCAL
jgi:hypothetical protein